jgi:thioredoxin-related protein
MKGININIFNMSFKSYFLNIILFLACFYSNAQQKASIKPVTKAPTASTGINWYPTISQALKTAKEQNKMLFIECYSPTCPVCLNMEPTLKSPEVGAVYNSNFINHKIDVGVAAQAKFLFDKNLDLTSFPKFLYFDSEGNIVHQGEVVATQASVIGGANEAKNEQTRAANYKNRFIAGERDFEFLVRYSSYAILLKDTTQYYAVADELFKIYPKDELNSLTSWRITKKCVMDIDNGFGQFWIDNLPLAAKYEVSEGHAGNEKNAVANLVMYPLRGDKGKKYTVEELQKVKKNLEKVDLKGLIGPATWQLEVQALIRENRKSDALKIGEETFAKFSDNVSSQIFIAKFFNDVYPDETYANTMKPWFEKIKKLSTSDKFLIDYYYEMARFNLKIGDKPKAKTLASQGLSLAVKLKDNQARFKEMMKNL